MIMVISYWSSKPLSAAKDKHQISLKLATSTGSMFSWINSRIRGRIRLSSRELHNVPWVSQLIVARKTLAQASLTNPSEPRLLSTEVIPSMSIGAVKLKSKDSS